MFKIAKFFARPIHQSHFVVTLCIGIIAGTILALVFRINFFASPLWLVAAMVALVIAYLRPRAAFLIAAIIAGMLLSFFRSTTELVGEDYICQFYNQTITVTGIIDGDPNHDEAATKFKINHLRFGENGEQDKAAAGNLYVSTKLNEDLHRSDQVTLNGKLLSGFGTYTGYLYKPIIQNLARPDPGDPVLNIRNWFAERIAGRLSEPGNSLGLSYLLGMKTGLPDELNDNLRTVGLVHIVVASGAHLSILVEIARRIFGKLSRFSGLLLSIIFILFFMALVGFTPSIMRAGIMSILTLIAWYVGHKFAPWRIILIVAAATLVINPMFIINLGWLLSFASFAGIMVLGPKLATFFYGDRQPKFIASVILTTISATLMTLPITLYYFGSISLISVIANLLILPTLPIAMGLTFFTGVLADVPLLNTVISFFTEKLLDFHIGIVNFFATQKSFLIQIDSYQLWVFAFYIPIIILLAYSFFHQNKRRRSTF
ncbi:MAG: ComEC/Rec2 family competence protein [Candidatus Saccharibacteria bacterium]|nr:ComEC/Rec2 family competence protein [Candidatus Saccharibacteria bacterium]